MERLHHLITRALEEFRATGPSGPLYDPVHYLLSIGGKRMRPALTLMGCELFGGTANDALKPALAVEIFHNFTLMHDDIMDKAPLRRGQPTVHERWDTNTAILSGDAMMILAYDVLCTAPGPHLAKLIGIFNTTAAGVCIGQQMDMSFETRDDVTVEEYIEMIRLKTAVLLGGALDLGATVAGAKEEDLEHLRLFGEHLGISFQLRDDYLDAFGDPALFGKQVGGDILSDKKTYLLIRTLEKAGPEDRATIGRLRGESTDPQEKVSVIRSIMQRLGADSDILERSEYYYTSAIAHLDALNAPEERKEALRSLAAQLMHRQS